MIKSVAIIVLNWNNARDTVSCLDSLTRLDYAGHWTIVVDNGSTDDSVAQILTTHPDVTLIETGVNLGYAGGNNVGIRRAQEHGVEFVWLLNDDVIVAHDSLSILVQAACTREDVCFLSPMVRISEMPKHVLFAGGWFAPGWQPQHRGLGDLDQGQFNSITEVDYVSGCALLIKLDVLSMVGLLDEDFFVYGEDVEWCFRANSLGFKTLFVPQAVVWHPDTRQRDKHSANVTYYICRNRLLFLRKHRLGVRATVSTMLRYSLWLLNWSVNPKWRSAKPKRDAMWQALKDFALGRFGRRRSE